MVSSIFSNGAEASSDEALTLSNEVTVPEVEASSSTTSTPRKRVRRAKGPEDEFRSKAKIPAKMEIKLRETRKKPWYLNDPNLINSAKMDIDKYDVAEKAYVKAWEEAEEKALKEIERIEKEQEAAMLEAEGGGEGGSEEKDKKRMSQVQKKKIITAMHTGKAIYVGSFLKFKADLGAFKGVPPEIFEQIAKDLPYLEDIISFVNTCRTTRNVLGNNNRHFWFSVGKSRSGKHPKFQADFDKKFNYFKFVKKVAGIEGRSMTCYLCFSKDSDTNLYEVLYEEREMRLCKTCLNDNIDCLSTVRCIPGLDTDGLHTFKIDQDSKLKSNARKHSIFEQDSVTRRLYVWKPMVERLLFKTYPCKSYDDILDDTDANRDEYEQKLQEAREAAESELVKAAIKQGEPVYKGIMAMKDAVKLDGPPKTGQIKPYADLVEPVAVAVAEKPDTVLPHHVIQAFSRMASEWYKRHIATTRQYGKPMEKVKEDQIARWTAEMCLEEIVKSSHRF